MTALAQAPGEPRQLAILLLEDNEFDAELTCASLGFGEGECATTRVDSRHAFEEAVKTCAWDVILADYSLPSFDGISALKIAQHHCPETPFIFVSGALGEELAIETLKQGATDYVLKHRLDRLRPSLLRALREKEAKLQKQRAEERLRELAEENKKLYEEARRANVAKDEFIAMISHELRTPMTAILGWTRMLKMGELEGEDFQFALNAVERSAALQAQLIEDLLDVSRIATGKLTLHYEAVDLSDVVKTACEGIRVAAAEKSIEIGCSTARQALLVWGDRNRLQQVVWNLLQNAVKFTPQGGRISIHLARQPKGVMLSVTDTGIGIRPQFLKRIFEPFTQDEASTPGKAGLGLGLSIVQHIVDRHGGKVVAHSEGEGKGSTFEVFLPLLIPAGRDPRPTEPANTPMPDLKKARILIVEDDREARKLIAKILSHCNAEVTAASGVDEALALLPSHAWQVIISDMAMPDRDGFELIKEITARLGADSPPVVAVTAFGAPADRKRIAEAGFVRHILKPVDPLVFARTVESVLEQHSKSVK